MTFGHGLLPLLLTPSRLTVNSPFTTGRITSADGTAIGYRRLGSGGAPALILVHGSPELRFPNRPRGFVFVDTAQ